MGAQGNLTANLSNLLLANGQTGLNGLNGNGLATGLNGLNGNGLATGANGLNGLNGNALINGAGGSTDIRSLLEQINLQRTLNVRNLQLQGNAFLGQTFLTAGQSYTGGYYDSIGNAAEKVESTSIWGKSGGTA
jgi:hypothetical protein